MKPSTAYPPLTKNADPRAYQALGRDYQRGDARRVMSRRELFTFARCPSRWLDGFGDRESDSMQWGALIDCLTLTPTRFEEVYAVTPETYDAPESAKKGAPMIAKPWNWNATACKEWRAKIEESGRICIKPDELAAARKAVAQIGRYETATQFITASETQVQVCVDYQDAETGIVVPLKCLIDLVPSAQSAWPSFLGDLKTTCNGHPEAWAKQCDREGYHWQAALYLDAYNAVTDEGRDSFAHIKQENFSPFAVSHSLLSEEFVAEGRVSKDPRRFGYIDALKLYCRCLATKTWPTYDDAPDGLIIEGFRLCEPPSYMLLGRAA